MTYILNTIRFTILSIIVQWFLKPVKLQDCVTITTILILKCCITPKKFSQAYLKSLPAPLPQAATNLLFCLYRCGYQDISNEWSHTLGDLLKFLLLSIFLEREEEFHPCCSMYHCSISFLSLVFYCLDVPYFAYPFSSWWIFWLFLVSGYY